MKDYPVYPRRSSCRGAALIFGPPGSQSRDALAADPYNAISVL
jgi:hypothetical protein